MSTVEQLIQIAAKRFQVEVTALEAGKDIFQSLGIDSMHVLELLTEVEMEFDVEIPDDDVERLRTIGDAIVYLKERLAE